MENTLCLVKIAQYFIYINLLLMLRIRFINKDIHFTQLTF